MKFLRALAPMLFLGASFGVACTTTTEPAAVEQDHTSCEGAKLDDNGICRKNGRFAKKICCAPPSYPKARQSLDSYVCPEEEGDVKVAFFDADSTLRISRGGTPTANAPDDVYVLPFVASKIKELNEDGYLVAIVSNQGGVAAGFTPLEVAEGGILFVGEQLDKLGAKIDYADFAEERNEFRKPETGMADLLAELLLEKCHVGIDFEASFMVGDAGYKRDVDGPHPDGRPADDFSNSDRGFADNLEIPFFEPTDYFAWRDYGDFYNIRYKSQLEGLLEAVDARIVELDDSGDDDALLETLRAEVAANRDVNELD